MRIRAIIKDLPYDAREVTRIRCKLGLTYAALMRALDVSDIRIIKRWEAGVRPVPSDARFALAYRERWGAFPPG